MALANREILLGVTGGIAAYKAADLCSRLVQHGANVSVVMTDAALEFIGPTTFAALTDRPVYSSLFQPVEHYRGAHIGLAQRAELLVIAPTSADFLGKLAHGLADDLLSTAALVASCPILIAPAMNADMLRKPVVQRNLRQFQADGGLVVDPGDGWLSCGQTGPGRMAEPAEILARIELLLAAKP